MQKRLGELLIEAGIVSAQAVEQALSHQKITGHRLGDCLVELGLVQEGALLRFLAAEFKTRFVSAEKLAQVKIAPAVLDRVPVRMAEKQDFIPIAIDQERKVLSLVMAEPQNESLLKEIAIVTEMNEVFAYVGIRSAIQAAIKKHYYGDPTAFSSMQAGAQQTDARKLTGAYEGEREGSARTNMSGSGKTASRVNPTTLRETLAAVRGTVGENDFVETLNILVGLIELGRKEFRGHSAHIARQSQLIARRIGLQPREVAYTTIAAYLHEVGKKPERHLTLPLIASSPEARSEAKRASRMPIKLFETVHLPGGVNAILAQLYEAFDGSGVPQGVKGEEISAGARVIAAVDAYFELTRNPANHLGKLLSKQDVMIALREFAGTLFDPLVIEALDSLQSGDILRQRVEQDGRQVLLADPDEGVRTDLLDALSKVGLVAQSVTKLDGIVDAVVSGEADTIAVGLSYGVADLASLLQFIRSRSESASVPVLVLGEPTDPTGRERLVQAGVTSFIPLPLDPDVAASTMRAAYVDRVEHGGIGHVVRGSFDELAGVELVRILAAMRKSGRVVVRSGSFEGVLQFERGRVLFAQFGDKKGDEALIPLFALPRADFAFEPESILSDPPNMDRDFDLIVRDLSSAST